MKIKHILFIIIVGLFLFNSCSEVINDSNNDSKQTQIQFLLTDAPGEYQQVNIDIVAVNVILNDSLIELATNQGIYNLLDFVNGKDTVLVTDEVPSGFISQVRLVLGENNTVMIDSVLHDIKTPSAQQSGLKLNVHEEFLPGDAYSYIIDFDADKSIVKKGNGNYSLKPVIRVFTEVITGSIEGIVQPAEARPLIMAISENDTSSTYADTTSGNFMLRGLLESSYSLEFHPVEGFKDTTLTDISVYPGQTTLIDTLRIK
ncbi:DUF4382 domain-containing protein [Bacteroidota bacterium]